MAKETYTSIRVTKNVRNSLQDYVEACYSDLSINSMLKVHMENLQEGHVRFPKYGIYECPESRKAKRNVVGPVDIGDQLLLLDSSREAKALDRR